MSKMNIFTRLFNNGKRDLDFFIRSVYYMQIILDSLQQKS